MELEAARVTWEDIEVIPRFSLLNDQLSLHVDAPTHAVHHLLHELGLQLLKEVIVHDGLIDEPLGPAMEGWSRESVEGIWTIFEYDNMTNYTQHTCKINFFNLKIKCKKSAKIHIKSQKQHFFQIVQKGSVTVYLCLSVCLSVCLHFGDVLWILEE